MKFKLNKKVKDRWVKALRSGKYTQGKIDLKCDSGHTVEFCCLGVARELKLVRDRRDLDRGSYVSSAFLPMEIQLDLADKNDSGNWSFKRIATWIEKNL